MDQARPVGRIDVISDVICPWCYIGKRQLERALDLLEHQHLRFTVAWHPFQLNPDMPCEGVDRAQYRLAKFGSLERSFEVALADVAPWADHIGNDVDAPRGCSRVHGKILSALGV